MKKTKEEIEKVLQKLYEQKADTEEDGETLSPLDRINIQIRMLEGKSTYATYSSETDQPTDSIAYDTKEWLNGEYSDSDEELFCIES